MCRVFSMLGHLRFNYSWYWGSHGHNKLRHFERFRYLIHSTCLGCSYRQIFSRLRVCHQPWCWFWNNNPWIKSIGFFRLQRHVTCETIIRFKGASHTMGQQIMSTKRASLLPKSGKAKGSLYFDSDADMQQRKPEDRPQVLDHTESVVSKVLAPVLLIVLATVVFSFNPFSCNLLHR